MQFIVLSSSRGTTFQSVIDALNSGSLTATCLGLITDKEDRQCIEKAEAANLPYSVVAKTKGEEREAFDARVHEAITKHIEEHGSPDELTVVAEMGWMWIHTPWFIQQFPNRILNVHPALLPNYGGKGMYGHHVHEAVLAAGETESGISIHIMDEGVDTGEIIVQKKCSINEDDTADTLQKKVQELEKEWYPKALQMIEQGEILL